MDSLQSYDRKNGSKYLMIYVDWRYYWNKINLENINEVEQFFFK